MVPSTIITYIKFLDSNLVYVKAMKIAGSEVDEPPDAEKELQQEERKKDAAPGAQGRVRSAQPYLF